MADQDPDEVTLAHPDFPGAETTVSPRKAKVLARQGWAPASATSAETVEQVKERVGTDPDAARAALAAEQARPNPRKGLVSHLTDLIPSEG